MQIEQPIISSTSNPTIKTIRKLRSRKGREQEASFWVEGIRLVGEAVQQGAQIELLVVANELLTSQFAQDLVSDLQHRGVPCLPVTAAVFNSLSTKDGPQGLGAVVRQCWYPLPSEFAAEDVWVALAEVQDPGNLGSIIRTADAVGCLGLILVGNCTDPYDPAAVRGSMGSLFALRLVKASEQEFLSWRAARKATIVGTSGAAKHHYRQVGYPRPLVLLSGSEREGLSAPLMEACDQLVSIPMVGRADSLNLAVATSVVLYEVFDQLSQPTT
ncbi:MAG TPA: RNA methyltransferase [Firmicutes bacterium]|nr:RNA methyltransferase [Bacillota bacterium]